MIKKNLKREQEEIFDSLIERAEKSKKVQKVMKILEKS